MTIKMPKLNKAKILIAVLIAAAILIIPAVAFADSDSGTSSSSESSSGSSSGSSSDSSSASSGSTSGGSGSSSGSSGSTTSSDSSGSSSGSSSTSSGSSSSSSPTGSSDSGSSTSSSSDSGSSTGSSETSGSSTSGSGSPDGSSSQGSSDSGGTSADSSGSSSDSGDAVDSDSQSSSNAPDSSSTAEPSSEDNEAPASCNEKTSQSETSGEETSPEESTDQSVDTSQDNSSSGSTGSGSGYNVESTGESKSSDAHDSSDDPDQEAPSETEDQDNVECYDAAEDQESGDLDEGDKVETESSLKDQEGEGNSYKAEITPDGLVDGEDTGKPTDFTITFTELGKTSKLGSAQVTINDDFTDLSFDEGSVETSNGQTWSGSLVERVLSLWAENPDSYLGQGESVSATFSATTPDEGERGAYEFETEAWTEANADHSGVSGETDKKNNMAPAYREPVVIVGKPVATADDLNEVRDNLNDHYVQTEDIDLSGWIENEGWEPIGNCPKVVESGVPFTGSYHGNNHTIKNLTINRPEEIDVGLFGFTGHDARIFNVNLENVDVTGECCVGSLVGLTNGYVRDCTVNDGVVTGERSTGGLVGSFSGSITGSEADVSVTGSERIGGLVGQSIEASIADSRAYGDVIGLPMVSEDGNYYEVADIGGLAGFVEGGAVIGSSASGTVSTTIEGNENETEVWRLGGLIGSNYGGWVIDCDAVADVTVTVNGTWDLVRVDGIGGLIGWQSFNDVINSTAGGDIAITINNDGNDVDVIKVGGLVGWLEGGSSLGSSASGNVAIEVRNAEHVNVHTTGGLIGELMHGDVQNSHATGEVSVEVENVSEHANIGQVGGLVGWIDVGSVSNSYVEGNSNVNLTVSINDAGHAHLGEIGGLIGHLMDGSVDNSSTEVDISATIGSAIHHAGIGEVGGLIGHLENGDVSDCEADATINTSIGSVEGHEDSNAWIGHIGGLVGLIRVDLEDQFTKGSVTECSFAGSISAEIANVDVYANLGSVGGLVGRLEGNLFGDENHSYNLGDYSEYGNITYSTAIGSVSATISNAGEWADIHGLGGLIGTADGQLLTVHEDHGDGWIEHRPIEWFQFGNVTGCTSDMNVHGIIESPESGAHIGSVGGLVGYIGGHIADSHAEAGSVTISINSDNHVDVHAVGGLAGKIGIQLDNDPATKSVIDGCSANIPITVTTSNELEGANVGAVGGLVGVVEGLLYDKNGHSYDLSSYGGFGSVVGSDAYGNVIITINSGDEWAEIWGTGGLIGSFEGMVMEVVKVHDDGHIHYEPIEWFQFGSVNGSSASGDITITITDAEYDASINTIGGLVGSIKGYIVDSHASGSVTAGINEAATVTGNDDYWINIHNVGGLVGGVDMGGISGSHATGDISALLGQVSSHADIHSLGGLAGSLLNSDVNDSWAEGNIDAIINSAGHNASIRHLGGLVGGIWVNLDVDPEKGSVDGCHATGDLYAHVEYAGGEVNVECLGGLVGVMEGYLVDDDKGHDLGSYSDYGIISSSHALGSVIVTIDDTGHQAYVQLIGGLAGTVEGNLFEVVDENGEQHYDWLDHFQYGNVIDSSASGNVIADIGNAGQVVQANGDERWPGISNIGGLAGKGSNITRSSASGDVSATIAAADSGIFIWALGGLAGQIDAGNVSESYASGNVIGAFAGEYEDISVGGAGGLIGRIWSGNVTNSYALGSVSGNDYLGGLVGGLGVEYNGYKSDVFVENCYAAGQVNATGGNVGGLVGALMADSTVTNSYYDSQTTGQNDNPGKGEPKPTAKMKQIDTFESWDIAETMDYNPDDEKVWYIYQGHDYPKLLWQYAVVTVTAQDSNKVYGDPDPDFSVTYDGFREGEHESDLGGELAFDREDGEDVGEYQVTPEGLISTCNTYLLTYEEGTLEITRAPLTITADDKTKDYNGAKYPYGDFTVSYDGFVSGDDQDSLGGELAFVGGAIHATDAGEYTITPEGLTSDNYDINYVDGQLTITKANLTVTAEDKGKVYDGEQYPVESFTVIYDGFASNQDQSVLDGALEFSGDAVGAVNAGDYNITPGGLESSNYQIEFVDGTLTIEPKAASVTPNAEGKTYGDADPELSGMLEGFLAADGVTADYNREEGENVGSYEISAELSATGLLENYDITYNTADFTISPREVTVTADSHSKVYGDADPHLTYTITEGSLAFGDDFIGSLTRDPGEDVDTYAIKQGTLSIDAIDNYNLDFVGGTLTITKAELIVTANNGEKTYGDTFAFDGSEFSAEGLFFDDAVSSVSLASDGAAETAAVGDYAIFASDAVGVGLGNYDITYVDGELTVTPKSLTITANDGEKTYGETFAFDGSEFSAEGLLFEAAVSSVSLASDGAAETAAVGDYAIVASDAVGVGLGNYEIDYTDGTLTVNKAPLTVTAVEQSKVYGDTYTTAEFSAEGLLFNDSVDSVDFTSDGAPATAGVGDYGIDISDAEGVGLANYDITYVSGELTVTRRALEVAAVDQSKVYGDEFTFDGSEFTVDGLANHDNITSVTLSSAGTSADSDVDVYNIEISGAEGIDPGNYDITNVDGELTVTQRALEVAAVDQSKVYGDEFTFDGTEFTVDGLADHDNVDSVTLSSNGTSADADVDVYDIEISDAAGIDPGNYDITYVDGELTVTPKLLTITANDGEKTYGETFAFDGSEFSAEGLLFDAAVNSVSLASDGAAETAAVGDYAIVASDAEGVGLNNYEIDYVDGTLTVNKVLLTVTAVEQSKVYGDTYTTAEFSAEGLLFNDSVDSVDFTSDGAPATAGVGAYGIDISDAEGVGLANYEITYVSGELTVTHRDLYIIANDINKLPGELYTFIGDEFTTDSLAPHDQVTSVTLSSDGAAEEAEVGEYVIEISDAVVTNADNYIIAYVDGTMTVATPPAPPAVSPGLPFTFPAFFTPPVVTPPVTPAPEVTVLEIAPEAPLVSPDQYLVIPPDDPETVPEKLLTPELLAEGTSEQLAELLEVYEQLLLEFDENWEELTEVEYAYALLDLSTAWAAIQALEARLALEAGEEADLDTAVEAYQTAVEQLEQYGEFFAEAHMEALVELLAAVAEQLEALGAELE